MVDRHPVPGRGRRAVVVLAGVCALALTGCSEQGRGLSPADVDPGQSTPVTLAQEQADGVVGGVLHTIADDLDADLDSAARSYEACSGADAPPGGVVVRTVVTLSAVPDDASQRVRAVLDDDGWTPASGASSTKTVVSKDDQTLTVASGPDTVTATLDSACIATSTNESLALQRREDEPVAWR